MYVHKPPLTFGEGYKILETFVYDRMAKREEHINKNFDAILLVDWDGWKSLVETRKGAEGRRVGDM